MKHYVQMQKVIALLENYNGSSPLPLYLKQHFRQHKSMGSRDRKEIGHIVFAYFRMHRCFSDKDLQQKILLSCCAFPNIMSEFIDFWQEQLQLSKEETAALLSKNQCFLQGYFPAEHELSKKIEAATFIQSHKQMPLTWIRVKKAFLQEIKKELAEKLIPYQQSPLSPYALGVEPGFSFSTLTSFVQGKFEIQDVSSQLSGSTFQPKKNENWWDCCAGSGGKSLLLHDQEPTVTLWVSDHRASILDQLEERFTKAGITNYKVILMDIVEDDIAFEHAFDVILVDAPCTGSGTWGRNPERMTFFDAQEIAHYVEVQQKIVQRVLPHLRQGGRLIFITCSVYASENENQAVYFQQNYGLQLLADNYIKGYPHRADTLYTAEFCKS